MKEISGHYLSRKGKTILFNVEIAADWNELNVYQTAALLEVLTWSKLPAAHKVAIYLAVLFGQEAHVVYNLPDEELTGLAPLTNFIVETKPQSINPLPLVLCGGRGYLSAAADLSNIGFGEWCFAYQVYHYYCQAKNDDLLDQLIAIVYRPRDLAITVNSAGYTGDLRLQFNENHIAGRAKLLAGLDPIIKHTVLAWFASALFNVMQQRPHIFPQRREDDYLAAPVNDESRTWFTVFRELLGPKWGTEDKLKYTNAMFILDALEDQEIERLKQPG